MDILGEIFKVESLEKLILNNFLFSASPLILLTKMEKFSKMRFVLMFCLLSLFQIVYCYNFKITNIFIDTKKIYLTITSLLFLYYYHYF